MTGTEGFNKASNYMATLAQRYGAKGVTQETNPFFQTFRASPRGGPTQNVLAKFEGSGPHKDEVIVVLAHLDHMGQRSQTEIFHGADDNASGSSTLASLVPGLAKLQQAGKLDRTVVLFWTAGEELGTVGARYFLANPPPGVEKEKIKGAINMDMVGRWGADRISVIDRTARGEDTFLSKLLEQENANLSSPFRINRDLELYRRPQDGAEFDRLGVPTLMLFEGLSKPTGGGDLIPEYHRTTDVPELILRDNNGDKMRKLRDLMLPLIQGASSATLDKE
jgi:hypothetical protein